MSATLPAPAPRPRPDEAAGDALAAVIGQLVGQARAAHSQIEYWPQDRVDRLVAAVGWELYCEPNAAACARLAVAETGMGRYEDKLLKHRRKTLGTLRDLHGAQTVGVVASDPALGLEKLAKPVGVVGAITPVTSPTATPACLALAALKTRNAIVFAPHPGAAQSTALAVAHARAGAARAGAPPDLVQVLAPSSREAAQSLMAAVDLVVAAGSNKLVRAAYTSGTPAYGVGAGNAVVIVDETADLADAAAKIAAGKTFDYATSCSSETAVLAARAVADGLLTALRDRGGYLCTAAEKARLAAVLWPDGRRLDPLVVGRPAADLARRAGIGAPAGATFLMVAGGAPPEADQFALEKLCPVLAVWRYDRFAEAIEGVERITRRCGYGHSCGIHSRDDARIGELARRVHVSRIMVRQAQSLANSGSYDNGMPFSLTLGCGTWGGTISSENIRWKQLLNYTWVARPIPPAPPDEEAIFGGYWREFGRPPPAPPEEPGRGP